MQTDFEALPRVVLFNINGVGLGHLSRSLAYARCMRGRAVPLFFSLASAIDVIHRMGFEADYFVSPAWSRSDTNAWERELLVRFALLLEEVRPAVAVFDGTWPFQGFLDACDAYGVPRRVWSNRALHKPDFHGVPVDERLFDLVIEPGELGAEFEVERAAVPGRKVKTPPVTLLDDDELLDRNEARKALGFDPDGRYALLSLGAGNVNHTADVACGLTGELRRRGFDVAYARVPISIADPPLPPGAQPIEIFPLVRYVRAFDVFVGAAGYNTCCEAVQSRVPTLLVPNAIAADDQAARAEAVARCGTAVVSTCETDGELTEAVERLLLLDRDGALGRAAPKGTLRPKLDGAARAADEILALCGVGAAA